MSSATSQVSTDLTKDTTTITHIETTTFVERITTESPTSAGNVSTTVEDNPTPTPSEVPTETTTGQSTPLLSAVKESEKSLNQTRKIVFAPEIVRKDAVPVFGRQAQELSAQYGRSNESLAVNAPEKNLKDTRDNSDEVVTLTSPDSSYVTSQPVIPKETEPKDLADTPSPLGSSHQKSTSISTTQSSTTTTSTPSTASTHSAAASSSLSSSSSKSPITVASPKNFQLNKSSKAPLNKPSALSMKSTIKPQRNQTGLTIIMSSTQKAASAEITDPPYIIVSDPQDSTTVGDVGGSTRTASIVVPIVTIVALVVIGLVVFLLYRRRQRHRKANIMKYKRHSQNGEVMIPLTSVSNETYRSSRVSAHEDAIGYSQYDRTIRPPRPTYRYKTEDSVPLKQSLNEQESLLNHSLENNNANELETILVDNANYTASPTKADEPPKVPMRKSSSESGSLKRTPGTNKRDISWPIPKGNITPNGSVTPVSVRSGQYAPPIPPSPRHGPPSNRPVPPSPRAVPPVPISEHSNPSTPSTPESPRPRTHNQDHGYDPVYVPRSDANAINQRLDDAGYVTSRRMRMNAAQQNLPYEDVGVYSEVASGSLPTTGQSSSAAASPSRSHRSTTQSQGSPSNRSVPEIRSESSDGHAGDRSFDTVGTETSYKVAFSMEDISKVCDDSFGASSTDRGDVEYSDIPDDYEYPEGLFGVQREHISESEGEQEDSTYEAVDFENRL